jgi:hypothetical protein
MSQTAIVSLTFCVFYLNGERGRYRPGSDPSDPSDLIETPHGHEGVNLLIRELRGMIRNALIRVIASAD